MGYMQHHAIIVTSWDENHLSKAWEKATQIFRTSQITPIAHSPVNDYSTFLIGPDGSKEGWDESAKGNDQRTAFIDWMAENASSTYLDWAEIQYGGDNCVAAVLRHGQLACYANKEIRL